MRTPFVKSLMEKNELICLNNKSYTTALSSVFNKKMKKNVKNMGFFIFFIAVKKKKALFTLKSVKNIFRDTTNNKSDRV
jgi:hypothetical protein